MADSKTYIAVRSNFSIHRPPSWVREQQGGELVQKRISHPPIEFSGGTYETADPDEQRAIEENAAFAETLEEGDVAPAPEESELEAAAEHAPASESAGLHSASSTLEKELDGAESTAEVNAILDKHDLPSPDLPSSDVPSPSDPPDGADDAGEDADATGEASEASATDASADATEASATDASSDASFEPELHTLEGVTKRAEAIAALESIEGLDVEVNSRDTVDEIVAFAREHGYRFEGWG